MAAPPITDEQWDKIKLALIAHPNNLTKAAKAAGVSRPVVTRALREGWPDTLPPRPPLGAALSEEKLATRAALSEDLHEIARKRAEEEALRAIVEADKARQEAVDSRRTEAKMVRGQRGNVVALMGSLGRVLKALVEDARKLEDVIKAGVDPATKVAFTVTERMRHLDKIGRLVKQNGEAMRDVLVAERLLLGEPGEILGIKNMDAMTDEEAIRELELAGQSAARHRERMQRRQAIGLRAVPHDRANGNGHDSAE